jgi:hypothetical protein
MLQKLPVTHALLVVFLKVFPERIQVSASPSTSNPYLRALAFICGKTVYNTSKKTTPHALAR